MKLADTPLAVIAPGDRVVSHTGMAGRIGAVLPAGTPAAVASDETVDRILVLWASGKWSLAPHASTDRIAHDVEPAAEPPSVSRLKRLATDLKAILDDMPPTGR